MKTISRSKIVLAAVAALMLTAISPGDTARASTSDSDQQLGELKVLGKSFVARRYEPPKPDPDAVLRRVVAKQASQARQFSQKFSPRTGFQSAAASTVSDTPALSALWLHTRGEGLFSVTVDELAADMGMDAEALRRQLSFGEKGLALTKGPRANSRKATKPVGWHYDAEADAVWFVGEAHDTFYTGENAYHLSFNERKSCIMRQKNGGAPGGQGAGSPFVDTLRFEQEPDFYYSLATIKNEPDTDFWFWDYLLGGYKDEITVDLSIPSPAAHGTGRLRVFLRGFTNIVPGDEHHVYAELNGRAVGTTVSWDGFEAATLTADFDQGLLDPEGNNTLRLLNQYTSGEHPGQ